MPPKSAKAKALPSKKAQVRKAATAKARKSASAIGAAAPKPAPKKSANWQAKKPIGTAQLVTKATTKKSVSPPNDKPKASKRSREEDPQPGKDEKPSPSQAYRDLMEANGADTFRALSSALISKVPCEVVMELIERGCGGANAYGKCQLRSTEGYALECTVTPLILASYHGSDEVVNQLLNGSALVDTCTRTREWRLNDAQAIHWAAARGHVFVVKALIAGDATLHALTEDQWTPLHFAASAGHLEVAALLLSSGADDSLFAFSVFHSYWTALHFAAYGGHTQVVELLIANQTSRNRRTHDTYTALHLACLKNHIGVVKALITANADVTLEDDVGRTPLFIAAQHGYIELVKELIAKTETVNTPSKGSGQTLLESTIPKGHVPVVLELLKHNAIVSARCLHVAARLESPNIMRALLAKGGVAHINAWDNTNETPLHISADLGNLPMVEELISHNADVNAINDRKITPLGLAVAGGHLPVVKRLLACTTKLSMAVNFAAISGNILPVL